MKCSSFISVDNVRICGFFRRQPCKTFSNSIWAWTRQAYCESLFPWFDFFRIRVSLTICQISLNVMMHMNCCILFLTLLVHTLTGNTAPICFSFIYFCVHMLVFSVLYVAKFPPFMYSHFLLVVGITYQCLACYALRTLILILQFSPFHESISFHISHLQTLQLVVCYLPVIIIAIWVDMVLILQPPITTKQKQLVYECLPFTCMLPATCLPTVLSELCSMDTSFMKLCHAEYVSGQVCWTHILCFS